MEIRSVFSAKRNKLQWQFRKTRRRRDRTRDGQVKTRDLRSFEIRFDSKVTGRFENFESPRLPRLPSYHKQHSLFNDWRTCNPPFASIAKGEVFVLLYVCIFFLCATILGNKDVYIKSYIRCLWACIFSGHWDIGDVKARNGPKFDFFELIAHPLEPLGQSGWLYARMCAGLCPTYRTTFGIAEKNRNGSCPLHEWDHPQFFAFLTPPPPAPQGPTGTTGGGGTSAASTPGQFKSPQSNSSPGSDSNSSK